MSLKISSLFLLSCSRSNHIVFFNAVNCCTQSFLIGKICLVYYDIQNAFVTQVLLVMFWEANDPAPLQCLMDAFQDSQPMNSSILLSLPPATALRLGRDEAQVACVPNPEFKIVDWCLGRHPVYAPCLCSYVGSRRGDRRRCLTVK